MPRRGSRWGRASIVCLVAATTVSAVSSALAPPAEGSPNSWTRSYYVGSPSLDAITHLGCANSDVSGRMTLFFGAPTEVGGTFGASLWGGEDRTVEQIGELARRFVAGYAWCRPGGQQILLGLGTSTSRIDTRPDDWLAGHGYAWAETVRAVSEWADAFHPGVARIYGAWDAEPSWSSYEKAALWMSGYNGVPGRRPVHAHFAADGCPRDHSDNGPCNNGWSQYHVWQLAWENDPSLPMPQIYATSGVNARQWQRIDEYGARFHNDGMVFSGAMSQWGACQQVGGCARIDNPPHMAHDQLLWELNTSPLTTQPDLDTITDMNWHP